MLHKIGDNTALSFPCSPAALNTQKSEEAWADIGLIHLNWGWSDNQAQSLMSSGHMQDVVCRLP